MKDKDVPLERKFSLVSPEAEQSSETDYASLFGFSKGITWKELESQYRVVILADAGAGKTFEMLTQARKMSAQELPAFFIRIEDIDSDFVQSFAVGTEEQFERWLTSSEPAWFFLDSVDEALLNDPKSFEKAIKRFSRHIKNGAHRAHIYISSRPYAWRFSADRALIESMLPFSVAKNFENGDTDGEFKMEVVDEETVEVLKVYTLKPLDISDIREFASFRSAPKIELLIAEIERKNLMAMASRPFDLDVMLAKWQVDLQLGSRLELMQYTVDVRLKEIDPRRERLQPLSQEKAKAGARLLAAAVTLSGDNGIRVPDSTNEILGVDASKLLKSWSPSEIQALLERGIFNDVIYGAVRFRHREIRELLTAEWFHSLLNNGHSRRAIEALFFQEKYGEKVIVPRLRPILPWLILFDGQVRLRALELSPEIAVEGGDVSKLPLSIRKRILADIVSQIASGEDRRGARDNAAIARIAMLDLSDITLALIQQYKDNDDVIFFLGRLVWQGCMVNCLEELCTVAINSHRDVYARVASVRAVFSLGHEDSKVVLWRTLLSNSEWISLEILSEILDGASKSMLSIELLLESITKLPPFDRYQNGSIRRSMIRFIERILESPGSDVLLVRLIDGIYDYLQREPFIERGECRASKEYLWLVSPALHAVEKLIACRSSECFNSSVIGILLNQPLLKFWYASELPECVSAIGELVPQWPELNDTLFWRAVETERERKSVKNDRLDDCWPVLWMDPFFRFDKDSFDRVVDFIRKRGFLDDKMVAISLAARLYSLYEKPREWLAKLEAAVDAEETLSEVLRSYLYPKPSERQLKYEEEQRQFKLRQEVRERRAEHNRKLWIAGLRNNPEAVSLSPRGASDEITNDQYWLLKELNDSLSQKSRAAYANWRSLESDFGKQVASAFRDAMVGFWRSFKPEIGSEGGNIRSYPYALIFAMTGIEIEANEDSAFPKYLSSEEVEHALRFITWELNGFPSWFEGMFRSFPDKVSQAVWCEL